MFSVQQDSTSGATVILITSLSHIILSLYQILKKHRRLTLNKFKHLGGIEYQIWNFRYFNICLILCFEYSHLTSFSNLCVQLNAKSKDRKFIG